MNLDVDSKAENGEIKEKIKRKLYSSESDEVNEIKKLKTESAPTNDVLNESAKEEIAHLHSIDSEQKNFRSPKKRLEFPSCIKHKGQNAKKEKFIYGNYSQYYGYRNKNFHDVRLDIFAERKELFEHKDVLDIGCNNGFITTQVAQKFNVKTIVGIDIDRSLIDKAIKNLTSIKKQSPMENAASQAKQFPYNVKFVHGNYILKNDCLLEIERPQFDTILCLSITKWLHLNFGDAGLKQAFRRMFLQLRNGGKLVLEAQPIKNYKKRKYLSAAARVNYENMKFPPDQFDSFLLSSDVGFTKMEVLGVPDHCADGFKRPIQVFYKE